MLVTMKERRRPGNNIQIVSHRVVIALHPGHRRIINV